MVCCSGVVVLGQLQIDFPVFQEEVHAQIILTFSRISEVVDFGQGVVRAGEGEDTVLDDGRVYLDGASVLNLLQVDEFTIRGILHTTSHCVAFLATAACCEQGCSQYIRQFFHSLLMFWVYIK